MAATGDRARAHVFVGDLEQPMLDDVDRHHLQRVLRVRAGEAITVSDGAGGVRACRFGDELEPAEPTRRVERPSPEVTVAFAPTKGDRPEWAVQKLTEVGVDRIVPLVTARSVVRWDDDRVAHHLARLRRVVREAAMQSRRAWLPTVEDVEVFADATARPGAVLADLDGEPPSLACPVVLIGPEGGWADEELEQTTARPRVRLGEHVLRTETAAVVAGSLLCALRAGMVTATAGGAAT